MHICHVNLASGFSGGERQTLEMIKQQLKLGVKLSVVANPYSPFFSEVKALGCKVFVAKKFWNAHLQVKSEHFDVIHVHDGKAVHWAYIQNLLSKTPYIITRRIDNPLKSKSYRQYRKAAALVGLSTAICQQLKEVSAETKIEKIPSSPIDYPSDTRKIQDIKARFGNRALVIQAANMYEHKGFDVSIKAAEIVEKIAPEIQFVFLGDGRMKATLELQASHLSNVCFVGKQSNMGDWFSAADLMIHPAYSEGLGSVILEALHCHLPVIATRAGGIPDIIDDGINGFLVDIGDAKSLAEKVQLVLNENELKQQLIDNIESSLEEFRIENTAQKYMTIYRAL
ncbi:glycosyltransferase family 4 protein [Vibrio sp. B1Z05]|uniref:glycosyltransferase family 4 protein n=1 Tax=Vibrio sp. B1Z05 TaxID=2654980 RepID=UPI00128B5A99|nr:glycosyltransferase family 4 protein [Vibrio sp. B1Z05]MPW37518.1 glycosyltransferase [Vibrio sp. B1Z05]